MLADLRDRLQSQGTIPELPNGWRSQSAMLAASGVGYGGDFLVANLHDGGRRFELILVDVCGKGVGAASKALQFGGALGGLIGALPPRELFLAANDFLLRQHSDETFATAVHVLIDLDTGDYQLTSAGHPPALVWSPSGGAWAVDGARGTALGITPDPDFFMTKGRLSPGDALMFYTDGVVETRTTDLDEGVAWLQREASRAIAPGFDGAADRIIKQGQPRRRRPRRADPRARRHRGELRVLRPAPDDRLIRSLRGRSDRPGAGAGPPRPARRPGSRSAGSAAARCGVRRSRPGTATASRCGSRRW